MVHVYITRRSNTTIRMNHMQQSRWAHRLLDMALEREYPKLCAPILLERDQWGKPFLAEYPDIFINLSHSGLYAACAIGEKPVGVDVEGWKGRRNLERIVKKFHPLEEKAFGKTEEEKKEELFYQIWVQKESFMKAVGKGLGILLDSFCVLPEKPGYPPKDRVYSEAEEELVSDIKQIMHQINDKKYYCKLYDMKKEPCSLAACSEENEFVPEPVWLEIPEGL